MRSASGGGARPSARVERPTRLEPPELLVPDSRAWHDWLEVNHSSSAGVRLVLARKGGRGPTSLVHAEALEEALCFGWIDATGGRRDDQTWTVRFQPRRPRSNWSLRNTRIVERLIEEGRMQPAGLVEVERAQGDGRWAAAYGGPAEIAVPPDLAGALAASPAANEMFARLNSQNRYAILYRVQDAKRPETRARRIQTFVEMLERGETLYPQRS